MVPFCVICPLLPSYTYQLFLACFVNSEPLYTLFPFGCFCWVFLCEILVRKPINTVCKCKTGSTKSEMSGICSRLKEKEVLKGKNLGRHANMAMFSRNFHSSESAELENCLSQLRQQYKNQ